LHVGKSSSSIVSIFRFGRVVENWQGVVAGPRGDQLLFVDAPMLCLCYDFLELSSPIAVAGPGMDLETSQRTETVPVFAGIEGLKAGLSETTS